MKLDTLRKLYINELRDLYNAENQLLKALPKMAKAASSEELKNAFQKHLEQTKSHVQRLEQVFEELDEKLKGKTCHGMKGLIEEEQSVDALGATVAPRDVVARVQQMLYIAEYKRRQAPPGVKVSHRSFGRDRRYPITNRFRER